MPDPTKEVSQVTEAICENAFLKVRLEQLQVEWQDGKNLIETLENKLRNVQDSVLRINGAITVLQERQEALAQPLSVNA